MPKGVYPRAAKIRTVEVTDLPDRQSANANVETVRQTDGLDEESTTTRLFGDIAERDELDKTDPNRSEEILQAPIPVAQNPEEAQEERFQQEATPPAPKPEEVKPEAPKPSLNEQPTDDFLDWEKLSGKKIRQKVDGKEVVVTVEDLKKFSDQDQIKKHLAEEANKVGDERRKLAEERRQLQELRQQRENQIGQPLPSQEMGDRLNPVPDPVLQRIQFLEAQVRNLAPAIQPVIYQANRQRVASELKAQGFDDFLDYLPKMEIHLGKVQDPQLAAFYDTTEGSKALYFQLKAADMKMQPPAPQPPARVEPQVRNPAPPATQIDGGSPSSGQFVDDSGHNYRAAFRRAQSSGDNKEAWNEVLRLKGILPE